MRLLIDTNVILDMVLKRKNCDMSMRLFQTVRESGADAYITASSVTDLFYIIRKDTHDTERTYVIMENIFGLVKVLSVTEKDIMDAFGKKWKDFEDCVQYISGKNNQINYIVTVNQKDYEDTQIPALTPQECIGMINSRR